MRPGATLDLGALTLYDGRLTNLGGQILDSAVALPQYLGDINGDGVVNGLD